MRKERSFDCHFLCLQISLDRVRNADPLTTGSAGQVDKAETDLQAILKDCEEASCSSQSSAQLLVNIKAGLQHLIDLIDDLPSKVPPIAISDDTLVEAIYQCGDRIEHAFKVISYGPTQLVLHSEFNVRIFK